MVTFNSTHPKKTQLYKGRSTRVTEDLKFFAQETNVLINLAEHIKVKGPAE